MPDLTWVDVGPKILDVFNLYRERVQKIVGEGTLKLQKYNNPVYTAVHAVDGYMQIFLDTGKKNSLGNPVLMNVATFRLSQLAGCCGVAVSSGSIIFPPFRGRGLGTLLNNFRIDLAREGGYGTLICTDVTDNPGQRKILQKNGWKDIHTFKNPRTSHEVAISVIDLGKVA